MLLLLPLLPLLSLPSLCDQHLALSSLEGTEPVLLRWTHNNGTTMPVDLGLQDAMRTLRRMERQTELTLALMREQSFAVSRRRRTLKSGRRSPQSRQHVMVLEATSPNATNGGRCIISADQAVHFCGFAEEVYEPPIPPPYDGICRKSSVSDRTICYPRYEELDTSCTDAAATAERSGLVAPPIIPHANVKTMAFVPPDNLQRLIRQYYRKHGKAYPKNETDKFSARSFLFVKYGCDPGYELLDEVDTMFCRHRQWVQTAPVCRGKGLCEQDNGGCSHSCLSFAHNQTVECRCPRGMVLDEDGKTCIKPVPKSLCRKLAGCTCTSIDDHQYTCSCPNNQRCLLMRGPPKIYLDPPPDYQVEPGGNLNISCAAVAYPFPQIHWEREGEGHSQENGAKAGTVKSEQVLIIKEIYKSTEFTCHANNALGEVSRTVRVEVTGPGSAPVLRELNAGRTSIEVHWEPPHVLNRPVTVYSVYYTTDPIQPIKNWAYVNSSEPNRSHSLKGLQPDTAYTIRIRAHDSMGPGKLSNPVSVRTLPPAKRPTLLIPEGAEIRVPPKSPFSINCNLTRGDPIPQMHWESNGRSIRPAQESRHIALQHVGLLMSTEFQCVAENEAGRTVQKALVTVTGPTQPERIRYHVDGNTVILRWEEPRITNGPMADYEVFFTDQPSLPVQQWTVLKSGGPLERSLTLKDLREMTDYSIKIRGVNTNGPGLFSLPFTVRTWLAPRAPVVVTSPEDSVRRQPSQEELEIHCEADGVPRPKILWWWEGKPVDDGKGGFRVIDSTPLDEQVHTRQRLVFQSTTRSGLAKCQAINEIGVADKTVQVQILGPGTPPDQISSTPVQNGFSVHWQPPTIPNGPIVSYVVYWSKDPDAELADWSSQTVGGDARSVSIKDQEEQTPYVFRVQAIGGDGPGIISPSYEVTTGLKHIPLGVSIRVLDPSPSEDAAGTLVDPGQQITFQCIAEGRPKPTVSFSWVPFNGSSEPGDDLVPLGMDADPEQAHRYRSRDTETQTHTKRTLLCEARNDQGQVQAGHLFQVLKPGGPPRDITPVVDVDNRVTISWLPPIYTNAPLRQYVLLLSADPSKPDDQWRRFVVPADSPQHVFQRGELEPETPYYIRVAAENDHGRGVFSEVTHFVTVSGAPLDAPTDLVVTVAPDNTISAIWGPPTQPNGPLRHYTVYFAPEDPADRDENYKRWSKVQVPLRADGGGQVVLEREEHNILPEHEYRLRVSATNDLNEGPPSAVARFTTGTGEIAPVVQLLPADNPASVLPLGDYSVRCEASGIPPPSVWWSMGTSEDRLPGGAQLLLSRLHKDTTAICHAENSAGKAQLVLEVRVLGPGTAPNEVVAIPMPEQALNVEWTAPDEPNGKLTGYVVHYAEVLDGEAEPAEDAWKKVAVGAEVNSHRLEGLRPKTVHWVRVQAVSDRGEGILSEPVKARTLPLAPKAPEMLPVQVHDNNTIQVTFIPSDDPEQEGKKVQSYRIHYTKEDPSMEDAKWSEVTWSIPPGVDPTQAMKVHIDGENFDPETKYFVRVIPIGVIEGKASEPKDFDTKLGIVAPDTPLVHIDVEDNVLKVPAGTDYTVACTSNGYPAPKMKWVDKEGNVVSEDGVLRVFDIRTAKNYVCVAENEGGRTETGFTVYVVGPGSAPENVRLTANRPKSILVNWDPPTIANGNITRYIIYYTPLDDQSRDLLVGQVPSKPVSEWMSTHVMGKDLGVGEKQALITDFVEADTAYAVVVQAANDDGPGPYSNQHNVRTMTRARAAPPTHLYVEPINQTSVDVSWKPAETLDESPTGYEIYFIPADKKIEEDEQLSLPKWQRVEVSDPSKSSHIIWNQLEPDTEYVFKIRALYPSGPGVFSEPCIAKTLPEGDAPYIVVSAGSRGTLGESVVQLLPGSDYTVFCRASGRPQPAVRWIRGGDIPIDPSIVKEDHTGTKWSLSLANITEPSTFNCVARNPLGVANWTIRLEMIEGLRPDWLSQLVRPENRQGQIYLHFADALPESLRRPNQWTLRYSDDPSKERILWSVLESEDRALASIPIRHPAAPMEPGVTYHLVVENSNEGVRSPVFTVLVPKAPADLRVGSNINDEMVVDFRPAIASVPVTQYSVRYWPAEKEGEGEKAPEEQVKTIRVPGNRTIGIRVPDLPRDIEFYFQAVAELADGQELVGPQVLIRTPAREIRCDCSHACKLLETDSVEVKVECYCPEGWELATDGKTCLQVEPTGGTETVVEVSPTFEVEQQKPEQALDMRRIGQASPHPQLMPTDEYGNVVSADLGDDFAAAHVLPTDSLGREIRPVVMFNGTRLRADEEHNYYDPLGRKIERDDEQRALGPDGRVLKIDARGNYVYPPLDRYGQPLPTAANLFPVYAVVDEEGVVMRKDPQGRTLDHDGRPLPTDAYGQPLGPGASPLPTNFHGQFVLGRKSDQAEVLPTDSMGYPIYPIVFPDGQLLPTAASGLFVDPESGEEVQRDEQGIPVDSRGEPLPKNGAGAFVFPKKVPESRPDKGLEQRVGDGAREEEVGEPEEERQPARTKTTRRPPVVVIGPDGMPLPTDWRGMVVDQAGSPLPTSIDGLLIGPDGSPLPTDSQGRFVQVLDSALQPARTLPTDDYGHEIQPMVDQFGVPLPTDSSGHHLDARGEVIATDEYGRPLDAAGNVLAQNADGQYVYTRPDVHLTPAVERGQIVPVVVDADGHPLPRDSQGNVLSPKGQPVPKNPAGLLIGPDGSPLPTNAEGQYVLAYAEERQHPATDSSGRVVHPDGSPLQRDPGSGRFVDPQRGEPIQTDDRGRPLDYEGTVLPTNSYGAYVWSPPKTTPKPVGVVGPDGLPVPTHGGIPPAKTLPTDDYGKQIFPVVDAQGQLLPTDQSGHHMDEKDAQIAMDEWGRPLDESGKVLAQNARGQYVYVSQTTAVPAPPAPPYPDDRTRPAVESGQCRLGEAVVDLVVAINDDVLHLKGGDVRRALEDLFGHHLDLAGDATRVGVLQYGKSVIVPVNLGGYHEVEELLDKLGQTQSSDAKLEMPDISAAYRAGVQQFNSFGRGGQVPKVLVVLSSGDDIFANTAKEEVRAQGAFVLLVGTANYDSEIAEESRAHLLVDEWEALNGARIAEALETECQRGNLALPKSRAKFVTGKAAEQSQRTSPAPPARGQTAAIRIAQAGPPASAEQCRTLQQRSRLLLVVETSSGTSDRREELRQSVLHFLREYVERSATRVGILYYGDTVEVGVDMGNYQDSQELEESVQDMHFVGGTADPLLAIRTAQQLFADLGTDVIKLVLHVYRERPSIDVQTDIEQIARAENIALLELDYARWGVLENMEAYWVRQLCMLEALIDRLENTVPADIDEIFFGPTASPAAPAQMTLHLAEEGETLAQTPRVLPTDMAGKPVHPVLGPDGQLLPLDAQGHYVDVYGAPIATDEEGRPLDAFGQVLPQDERGFYLYTFGPDRTLPTSGPRILTAPDGSPLPTDGRGNVLRDHEVGRGEMALPTDQTGKFIHPVLNARTGEPLATDQMGRYVEERGELIPVDDFGRPLDVQGVPLPTNIYGQFLYSPPQREFGTGEEARVVGRVLDEASGAEMPRNEAGMYTDLEGNQIALNARGEPLGRDGRVLSRGGKGEFVWPAKWRHILVIGPDGTPLPTDARGVTLDARTGSPLPTNIHGVPVGPDGHPLPTDSLGRFVVVTVPTEETSTMPTDDSGKQLYPVVDQFGAPLPTDAYGHFLDPLGEPIPLDDNGRPLQSDGRPLPTNRNGEFVYTLPGVSPTPAQATTYRYASPRPTDRMGQPMAEEEEEGQRAETLPTDGTGKLVYPVVSEDTGMPLARNEEGRYVTAEGEVIALDDFGRPLDHQGHILPVNELGQYVFRERTEAAVMPPAGSVAPPALLGEEMWTQRRRNQSTHCFVGGFIELLNVFDTSSNVKILDYRMMKEAVKGFLVDHFDLRPNHGVRVGLLKYGDSVEVPVALGDYDSEAELLARVGETRRLKGEPQLESALKEAASEFHLSGADDAPRVVIVWKSGNSSTGGDLRRAADQLRQHYGALILVVSASAGESSAEDLLLAGSENGGHVLSFDGWAAADSDSLGALADAICRAIPSAREIRKTSIAWPSRPKATASTRPSGIPQDCRRVDYAVDLILALDSSNFDASQFAKIVEGLGTLVDESFDLSPDVVRIGFLVYSDNVAVPVALGHYEDKIELLSKMAAAQKLSGTSIALRGLEAARQQFQLHGRDGVAKVILLVTNGKHRGNAAVVAQELRDHFGVQIFSVAIAPTADQLASLTRIVGGQELARQKLLRLDSADELADSSHLAFLRRSLCAGIGAGSTSQQISTRIMKWTARRSTVKRAIEDRTGEGRIAYVSPILSTSTDASAGYNRRVTRILGRPIPLCRDGFLRPYLISVVLDLTQNGTLFDAVLAHLGAFVEHRFSVESQRVRLHLIGVDAKGVRGLSRDVPAEHFAQIAKEMGSEWKRESAEGQQPMLGAGVGQAAALASEAIPGTNRILVLLSGDGTSSDAIAVPEDQHLVAISMGTPRTDLMRRLAGGSATRVVHFADWLGPGVREQFDRWLAFAICEAILGVPPRRTKATTPLATTTSSTTTRMPKWRAAEQNWQRGTGSAPEQRPWDVLVRPLSATSLSVSWSCCSSPQLPQSNYSVLFSSSPSSAPFPAKWSRVEATCRDSFGLHLAHLPPEHDFMVCVLSAQQWTEMGKMQRPVREMLDADAQCDRVWLPKESSSPATTKSALSSPCVVNCACDGVGRATASPCARCECRRSTDSGGNCPAGFRLGAQSECLDMDECASDNGRCSHGCVNTPGSFYCACPPGLVLDPALPGQCIPIEGGMRRAADLLGHLARLAASTSRKPAH